MAMDVAEESLQKKSGRDREKHRASVKACRLANADKIKAYSVTYYAEHREEILAKKSVLSPEKAEEKRIYNAEYYVKNKEKEQIRKAIYRANHPEETRAYNITYRAENLESEQARQADWRDENRPRLKAYNKTYRLEHPEETRAKYARRRARKRNAPVSDFTAQQWIEMQAAYDHRCVYCDKRCKGRLTQDHITPLSKGGSHTASNIVPACSLCNSRKGTKDVPIPIQPLLFMAS
jgi:5-methylcytosine-specific restriction endonuclease McrA